LYEQPPIEDDYQDAYAGEELVDEVDTPAMPEMTAQDEKAATAFMQKWDHHLPEMNKQEQLELLKTMEHLAPVNGQFNPQTFREGLEEMDDIMEEAAEDDVKPEQERPVKLHVKPTHDGRVKLDLYNNQDKFL
jgi:hypothetical protein